MGGEETHMEFPNRGNFPLPQQNTTAPNPIPAGTKKSANKKHEGLVKWTSLALGGVIALLMVAVILVLVFSTPKSQGGYVYTNKLQAVFLNNGQVYFGNIKQINPQYLVLVNIYYLQTNSKTGTTSTSSASSNVSLVKLGCELHAPYDQMVINMQQVSFWENLQSTGQVAKAVAQYQKEYPHGQVCSNQNSGSGSVQSTPTPSSSSTTKP